MAKQLPTTSLINEITYTEVIEEELTNCQERLATFMATVSAKTDVKTNNVTLLGPVVGTHAGQGCVAVAYFEK